MDAHSFALRRARIRALTPRRLRREDATRLHHAVDAGLSEEDTAVTTRRDFLGVTAGALAGLAFVGCDLLAASPARAQARRREVVVNGRRAKTVDVHAHCAVPEALALMNQKLAPGTGLPPILNMATE